MGGAIVATVGFLGALATIGAFAWAVRERNDRRRREWAERIEKEKEIARAIADDIEAQRRARQAPKVQTFTQAEMWKELRSRADDKRRRMVLSSDLPYLPRDDRPPRRRIYLFALSFAVVAVIGVEIALAILL